jgi:hypothetical protein
VANNELLDVRPSGMVRGVVWCLSTCRSTITKRRRVLNVGPTRFPETSVNNYHTTPRNMPEEGTSRQHRGGNLKSR